MHPIRQALPWSLPLALFATLAAAGQSLEAQNSQSRFLRLPPTPDLGAQDSRLAEIQSLAGYIALEGALDPNEYKLGPGDLFAISVGGIVQANVAIPVSSSGVLPLPEAPEVYAAGRTLAAVKQEAVKALKERYVNVPVSVILVQPRMFYVHVTGAVTQPGRFMMLPVSRVSDAVTQAHKDYVTVRVEGAEDPAIVAMPAQYRPPLSEYHRASLRNVRIVHLDGSETLADLIRYQITGEMTFNPYLRDGDRIIVPTYNVERDGIRVSGDIAWPGAYDLRPDDSVESLLHMASAGAPLSSFTGVRLVRRQPDGSSTVIDVDLPGVLSGSVATPTLQPGDHLSAFNPDRGTAIVDGRVRYPGAYRIESGVTTLRELIAMAGGLRDDASVVGAVLERSADLEMSTIGTLSDGPNNRAFGLGDTDAGFRQYQQFDFFAQGFAQPWAARRHSRVSADIAGALTGTADDVVIYDGDRLTFPRNHGAIFVTGHVPQRSYVAFVEGQTVEHYVRQAGGLGPGAGDVFVFTGSSDQVRRGFDQAVHPGDAIFVDRVEQLTLETEQLALQTEQVALLKEQSNTERRSLILSAIATTTSIVITYIALFGQ